MRRPAVIALALAASALLAVPAMGARGVVLTPVGRVPFPARGYIVDLPQKVAIGSLSVHVLENGRPVRGVTLSPVAASDLSFGAVLAIDASDSMVGKPYRAALEAARTFVDRRVANEQVGLVAFNGHIRVVQRPSLSEGPLRKALANAPRLAYGTRIYDALGRSLALLEQARISAGAIVLLSDGADVGSRATLRRVIARARRDHVRIFTVGLRSKTFEPAPLRLIAGSTGASYAEAESASQLKAIYGEIGGRLASEYFLQYRSNVNPGTSVRVSVAVAGLGNASAAYVAPTPSGLAPFHRSLVDRFVLSPLSLVLLSLIAAALAGGVLYVAVARPRSGLLDRLGAFVDLDRRAEARAVGASGERRRRRRREGAQQFLARLEQEFDIAGIGISPTTFSIATVALTVLVLVLLAAVSPALAPLALLVPVAARMWVSRKVQAVRNAFADQLPATLQLLASALRSGHSFIGALSVVVERAPEPIRREFNQVLTDDQLGVPIATALRSVADRMKSRDMQQVGVLGELQRTVGGNSAEVLDTVVTTVRERAEVRRLMKTLTAQGRLARWILSVIPVVLGLLMFLIQPDLMKPMLVSPGGQVALVIAAIMAVAGSLWIKRIVEIDV